MKKLLWHMVVGTRGGLDGARILGLLKERPNNANSLAEELRLDYRTVRDHLKVLRRSDFVMVSREEYGTLYFLSPVMAR
ncbi:MAG: winged helix-turn-helix domain-containing protein, partial [Candidatus Thermoplasmatota archaeon]|nr:winged helix-turn-helix domain-containing protein [Candidatus Thermoplasmatota archaeon]